MDFSTALSTWKDINLTGLQHDLDKTALELVEQQKEGLVGRKKLAEQTRGPSPLHRVRSLGSGCCVRLAERLNETCAARPLCASEHASEATSTVGRSTRRLQQWLPSAWVPRHFSLPASGRLEGWLKSEADR
jgi:hypothetical protein